MTRHKQPCSPAPTDRADNPLVAGGGEVWKDDVKLISLSSFVERGMQ
jgi:hypothetical protein